MAGDRIHTSIDYYYTAANTSNSGASGITSLLTNLASAIMGSPATGGILKDAATDLTNALAGNAGLISLLNTPNASSGGNQAPKAYLHVLFFNEQFKFDENASVVVPVSYTPGTKGTISKLASNAVEAKKNGYVYVYFSNETEELVFFDNFKLSHERGRILEETHYYAFGLTMAGISSKAAGIQPNQYLFNDATEFNESLDVGLYETEFRLYDPQIGRFWQVDELSDFFEDWSPYSFAFNNPITYNDPHGLNPEEGNGRVEDLEPVVVVGKRKSNYELYLERLRYGRQNGEDGPKFFETDGENLRARINWVHEYHTRRREMNEDVGTGVVTIVTTAIPLGNLVKLKFLGKALQPLFVKFGNKSSIIIEGLLKRYAAKTGTTVLEGAVKSNYGRFVSKMPANAKSSATFKQLKDGSYLFEATSPGKVPGSSALYQKWVNPQGETFKMIKTTFAPDGSINHVKPKF